LILGQASGTSPPLRVAAFVLVGLACRTSTPVAVHRPAAPIGDGKPAVFLLTSSAACEDGRPTSVEAQVSASVAAIRRRFPEAVSLAAGEGKPIGAADGRPVGEAAAGRVLLLFYAGHAESKRDAAGKRETHLCIGKGREVAFHELAAWVAAQQPAAALVVIDACESGDVDPSAALGDVPVPPISVLSASIDQTTPSLRDPSVYATPLIGLIDTLLGSEAGARADRDCDGELSDEELFAALEPELRARSWAAIADPTKGPLPLPAPKLRRNADAPLLLLPTAAQRLPQCKGLIDAARPAEARLGALATALRDPARVTRDHFFLTESNGDPIALAGCGDATPALAPVCAAFAQRLSLVPGLLPMPSAERRASLEALARRSRHADVFAVDVTPPWIQVVRLRDGVVVASTPLDTIAEAVPARAAIVRRSGTRVLKRYAGRVCRSRLDRFAPVAEPCAAETGQCFWLDREPAPREDECEEQDPD
jgi:hypothetical protein